MSNERRSQELEDRKRILSLLYEKLDVARKDGKAGLRLYVNERQGSVGISDDYPNERHNTIGEELGMSGAYALGLFKRLAGQYLYGYFDNPRKTPIYAVMVDNLTDEALRMIGVLPPRQQQEGTVTDFLPTPTERLPFRAYAGSVLLSAVLYFFATIGGAPVPLLSYVPILVGFWLGAKRRGRPYWIFVISSVFVGLLTFGAVMLETWFFGDLPPLIEQKAQWLPNFAFWFVAPALLFFSGTLLGDVVKRRAWPESFAEPTPAQGTRTPAAGLSVRAQIILAIVTTLIAAIIGATADILIALFFGQS